MSRFDIIETDIPFENLVNSDINEGFTTVEGCHEKDVFSLNKNSIFSIVLTGACLAMPNTTLSFSNDNIQIEEFTQNCIEEVSNYEELVSKPFISYIKEINNEKINKYDIIKDILSFKSLKNNWDGYGSIPLEIESASNVISLIDKIGEELFCSISDYFPNPNGTITLIWENSRNEIISAEIGNNTMSYFVELASQDVKFFDNVKINTEESKKMAEFINIL